MQLTERHYAKWIPDGDTHRPPIPLESGEAPTDMLARLANGLRTAQNSPKVGPAPQNDFALPVEGRDSA